MLASDRTIRRNSREAQGMWGRATRAISYSVDNGFVGEDATVEGVQAYYERTLQQLRPSVTAHGCGYRIQYHSNLWVDLLCPPDSVAVREP